MMRTAQLEAAVASLLIGCLALVLACTGCGDGPERVAPGTPVVLISIDTLRADRLPAYGYRATQTPAIDRLAQDGVLFEQAYSHSPLTLPSHVSLLTGLPPTEHRIRDNIGYPLEHERMPLLQRTLSEQGYRTGGFVSSFVLRRGSGIGAGFDVYDDGIDVGANTSLAALQRSGDATLTPASQWLDGVVGVPFFMFFHIYEPHSPYAPPDPFASRYTSPYDGEVAAADAVVGRLLERLDRLDLYDRSLILLVSDHGEGLGEHGEQEHGVFLYRSTLQVPLLLKLPHSAQGGSRVKQTVQLVDLFPTVVSLLGKEPDSRLSGVPLTETLRGVGEDRAVYAETFYPRLHFGWSELFSVVRGRHHFIDAPQPELYDLVADPAERTNLVQQEHELHRALSAELERHDRTLDPSEPMPEETRRQLAALGYVGTAAVSDNERLPDPKQQIGALDELRRAALLFEQQDDEAAIPVLRQLLRDQPQILDGWDYLARSLARTGRTSEALETYRRALSRFTGTPLLSLSAAQLQFRLGMLAPAQLLAEAGVTVDPASAHALLSQIALRRGSGEEAERHARLALEARDSRPGPELAFADVLIARERFDEALQALERLESRLTAAGQPERDLLKGLSLLRGKALASQGRAAEAEQAFMKEIELFPVDPQAYTHLAVMYGLLGMPREAVVTVGKLLQVNGSPLAFGEAIRTLDLVGARSQVERVVQEARRRYPEDPYLVQLLQSRGAAP
jgi:arylsulfatase A-like enzyme